MAEEDQNPATETEEESLASRAGSFLWKNLVWDDEASFLTNSLWLASYAVTGGAAAVLRGGKTAVAAAKLYSATSAVGKTVAKGAAQAAEKVAAKAAVKEGTEVAVKKPGFLGQNVTRGGLLATHAAAAAIPVATVAGLSMAEHESGGALSETALDGVVSGVRAGIESGAVTYETLEDQINRMGYIVEVSNAMNKAVQNQVVRLALGEGEQHTAEDIEHAKYTAIGYQLKNLPLLSAKTLVRMGVVDKLERFEGDRDAADKYLAEQFVDDIIKGADVRALRDHPVTKDDVKLMMEQALETKTGKFFVNRRLENGLRQMWPDMFDAAVPDKPQAEKPGLVAAFDQVRTSAGHVADDVKQRVDDAVDSFSMNALMNIPVLGPILGALKWFFEKIVEFVAPLFGGADKGSLIAQGGTSRMGKLMSHHGHVPPAGAEIAVVSHDGQERGNVPVVATVPGLAGRDPVLEPTYS